LDDHAGTLGGIPINTMNLDDYGWNKSWETQFLEAGGNDDVVPARVTAVYSDRFEVATAAGTKEAVMTGRLRYNTTYAARKPSIGDWVMAVPNPHGPYAIRSVLPRETCLQRQGVDGNVEAQVIGANIHRCMLLQALVGDFNLARLDRYLSVIWDAGITPLLVLTKADLLSEEEVNDHRARAEDYSPGLDVVAVSSISGYGVDRLRSLLTPGTTNVAIGSSGVGKSTLLNLLLGEEKMDTADVRQDDQRGRHTTTHRQMFRLPGGALFIDTPGMREIGLFNYDGVKTAFADIARIAARCKFTDCTHTDEPECAVREALASGDLDPDRWESFQKLKGEERFLQAKEIKLGKKISKARIKRQKVHYKDFKRGRYVDVDDDY